MVRIRLQRERERNDNAFPSPGDPHNCLTRERWSAEKTQWCCEHKSVGCPKPTPAPTVERPPEGPPALDQAFYRDYQDYDVLVERMEALQSTYPDHVALSPLGKSHEGRDILGLEVRSARPEDRGPTRTIVMTCMLHAREWLTAPTCIYIAERLAMAAADGEDFKGVVVKMAPVVNPDGYIYSRTTYNWQRKNMHRITGQHASETTSRM